MTICREHFEQGLERLLQASPRRTRGFRVLYSTHHVLRPMHYDLHLVYHARYPCQCYVACPACHILQYAIYHVVGTLVVCGTQYTVHLLHALYYMNPTLSYLVDTICHILHATLLYCYIAICCPLCAICCM